MRVKTYVRVGYDASRRKTKVVTSAKPNFAPLEVGSSYSARLLPTVAFALVLDIPESEFAKASEVLATIQVPEGFAAVAANLGLEEIDPDDDAS